MPATRTSAYDQIVRSPTISRSRVVAQIYGEDPDLQDAFQHLVSELKSNEARRKRIGESIGSYAIVGVLGRGGMSTVYLAERVDRQYSAQVAVKVFEHRLADVAMRFRAERQVLASLNHVGIGRLLDAGETADGMFYLVMEYLRGEPLDQYCDQRRLGINERIELVEKVCEALAYAHHNLIIHCDLKPANILVTSEGQPKLLDFGIARLLNSVDEDSLILTRESPRLLTPEYSSPEQIIGRPLSTATDVYSLGSVLYELLTGRRPHVAQKDMTQLELERAVCIIDPPRPSKLFETDGQPAAARARTDDLARARNGTPKQLKHLLSGDLDAIVMSALRKEPRERYQSASAFAEDLRRYRHGERISTNQGGFVTRMTRLLRSALARTRSSTHAASGIELSNDTLRVIKVLSAEYHLPPEEIISKGIASYQVEESDALGEELATLLKSSHEHVAATIEKVDTVLAETAERLRRMGDDRTAARIQAEVSAWANRPEYNEALRALGSDLSRAKGIV